MLRGSLPAKLAGAGSIGATICGAADSCGGPNCCEGLPYSLTLMLILLAHEFGHYFACRYHRVACTLPYFLPAPFLIGTFGAFIRFRSALKSRKELFDVGIAGPLAGFVLVLPVLIIGLALSRVVPHMRAWDRDAAGLAAVDPLAAALDSPRLRGCGAEPAPDGAGGVGGACWRRH